MTALVPACSSDAQPARGSTADAYAVVVRWFVDHTESGSDHPVVFAGALGEGISIGLDTQAAVISATAEFADVRFIDDRSEVFENDAVRDDGILVALGPAVESEGSTTVESAEFTSPTDMIGWTFDLAFRNGTWNLSREPTRVG